MCAFVSARSQAAAGMPPRHPRKSAFQTVTIFQNRSNIGAVFHFSLRKPQHDDVPMKSARIRLRTSLTPAECVVRLQAAVDPEPLLRFGSRVDGRNPVIGKVDGPSLHFRKRISYRNSFQHQLVANYFPLSGTGLGRLSARSFLGGKSDSPVQRHITMAMAKMNAK